MGSGREPVDNEFTIPCRGVLGYRHAKPRYVAGNVRIAKEKTVLELYLKANETEFSNAIDLYSRVVRMRTLVRYTASEISSEPSALGWRTPPQFGWLRMESAAMSLADLSGLAERRSILAVTRIGQARALMTRSNT